MLADAGRRKPAEYFVMLMGIWHTTAWSAQESLESLVKIAGPAPPEHAEEHRLSNSWLPVQREEAAT